MRLPPALRLFLMIPALVLPLLACYRPAHAPEAPFQAQAEGAGGPDQAVGEAGFGEGAGFNEGAGFTGEGADPRIGTWREQARERAAALDDPSLAAQVIMSGIDGNGALTPLMGKILEEVRPGAVILFGYNLNTDKGGIRRYMGEVSRLIALGPAGIPPLIAVDHEGGQVHRFGAAAARLPAPAAYGEMARRQGRKRALAAVRRDARDAGAELRDLGITMNLAPVAELLTGENRPFLEDRSYGGDGAFTEAAARTFIRSMEERGVLCAVKHFPGNSGADPHLSRPLLSAAGEDLDNLVQPFAGIFRQSPPPAVMVSHIRLAARDPERPASLSPVVIRDWLRGELGFDGMILADDFSMEAASGFGEAEAVLAALRTGVDMVIVWPGSLLRIHRAILRALEEGGLPRERLREAAARIIFEKFRFGILPQNEAKDLP
jgi:beta-N-acetylhexosaminidase